MLDRLLTWLTWTLTGTGLGVLAGAAIVYLSTILGVPL